MSTLNPTEEEIFWGRVYRFICDRGEHLRQKEAGSGGSAAKQEAIKAGQKKQTGMPAADQDSTPSGGSEQN